MTISHGPLVSIITPSYNQGKFIQETIISVLGQSYRNIEHIVVDGGSTDNTLSILQRTAQADARFRFISEPDRGQSHAINKGLAMARGEIIGWLNSDDTYLPGAIQTVVQSFLQHPEWGMTHGQGHVVNEVNQITSTYPTEPADANKLYLTCCICQPAAFIRKSVFEQMGGVDEKLHFCMDYELWMRIAKTHKIGYIPEFLANARLHSNCKSATQWQSVGVPEVLKSLAKHYGGIPPGWISYAPHYQGNGVFSLLSKLKTGASGMPRIGSMNRSLDLWVPPIFRVQVVSDQYAPARLLLVKGRMPEAKQNASAPLTVTILVNGIPYKSIPITKTTFFLEIPLHPTQLVQQVDISSSPLISPASLRLGSLHAAGFMAQEVHPLTQEEMILFKAFTQNTPLM